MSKEARRIMYVCQGCLENNPEACGHFDRNDLRIVQYGAWRCFDCFDEEDFKLDLDAERPAWSDLPIPPEYKPVLE